MEIIDIDKARARKIILHAAALDKAAPFGYGKEAVSKLIDHLGYIQIDTNYIVERAHHHVIYSRVSDYQTNWLDKLQANASIYEFPLRYTGFMPMKDFRFSSPLKKSFRENGKPLSKPELTLMRQVLDRIGREGPLMVSDFEYDRVAPGSGWWDWRPAKLALERLYLEGELSVTRTHDFKKIYDLASNLQTDDQELTPPTEIEYVRHLILTALRSMGVVSAKEISWRGRYIKSQVIKKELEDMAAEGIICKVNVSGLDRTSYYMLTKYIFQVIDLSDQVHILSPFDILNVFRYRLMDFFSFDYQIECFVPKAKRRYGYFSLPILLSDSFIARMDAKADRKKRCLIIHDLHFELPLIGQAGLQKLTETLKKFAVFNKCVDIVIYRSNHKTGLSYLKAALE